jgi:hypothetical protein
MTKVACEQFQPSGQIVVLIHKVVLSLNYSPVEQFNLLGDFSFFSINMKFSYFRP